MNVGAQFEQPNAQRAADETRSAGDEKLFCCDSANLK